MNLIKDNIMDSHNHFCIYCGAKLIPNQHFCSKCGKEIYQDNPEIIQKQSSKYDVEISEIEKSYNSKQYKASQLIEKSFDPSHMAYDKFKSAIDKSNQLFNVQLNVTKKMIELDIDNNELVEREITGKIEILKTFISKMDSLINELIIHLSSNKKDNEDVNNLFEDMDSLIDSVKNY